MILKLITLLSRLMFQPAKAWSELSEKEDLRNSNFYKSYLYPLFGLIALFSFIGALIHLKSFDVAYGLRVLIVQIIVYAGSFFTSSLLLNTWLSKHSKQANRLLSEQFVGYSSAWIYFSGMILLLFQQFPLILILSLLGIFTIMSGVKTFLHIKKEDRAVFSLVGTVIIYIVYLMFNVLSEFILNWMLQK